jgi:hypothetical protein
MQLLPWERNRILTRTPRQMTDKLDNSAPFNDDQGTRVSGNPTGAGAEAAEGIHGRPGGREANGSKQDGGDGSDPSGNKSRKGSEPLPESRQHRSNYGGDAGKPKDPA